MLKKIEVMNLIEPHFHTDLKSDAYKLNVVSANKLLVSSRLDLAFKLYYLDVISHSPKSAKEVYEAHIGALSLGKFNEPGNEAKSSIIKYIAAFDDLFSDMKETGFDSSKTVIPISKNGTIANGAHRVSCAIYLNENVTYVDIDSSNHIYDYKFFYQRNVPKGILEAAVTKFIEFSLNSYIAVVWPTAVGKDEEIENIIPNIIYRKNVSLNPNGAHNFLSQVYAGEAWLGDEYNNYKGAQGKLIECFKSFGNIRLIAFHAESLNEVLVIKEKIRMLFNVGKHSIHITDSRHEALRTARLVFNDNSIHFLNYARPNKYLTTHKKICEFKEFVKINNSKCDDFLIDSSLILSLYGLREAVDIDYLASNELVGLSSFNLDINAHDDELKHYNQSKSELIFNQKYHFYFNELKFISFNKLYEMKQNRSEQKDINDCKIMDAYMSKNSLLFYFKKMEQALLYQKVKLKKKLIVLLKFIGIFNVVKTLLRR